MDNAFLVTSRLGVSRAHIKQERSRERPFRKLHAKQRAVFHQVAFQFDKSQNEAAKAANEVRL